MKNPWPDNLDSKIVENIIDLAFKEDVGSGDLTSEAVIPPATQFSGTMSAREKMVCAGLPIAEYAFTRYSPNIKWKGNAKDGDQIDPGHELAYIEGPAIDLLTVERTAINILQHLSGIATLTRDYLDQIADLNTILLDTRKTIPAFRHLAKYATRVGGATNHRMSLDDGVLIKDNHNAVCGGISRAINEAKFKGLEKIEVECDTLEQVREALKAGADMILFDNMNPETMKKAVKIVDGQVPTEASGDINIQTIREKPKLA